MTTWPVRHSGIGVIRYDSEQEAITAAGTAGTVLAPVDCACGHPAEWHRNGRCAGDLLACRCVPAARSAQRPDGNAAGLPIPAPTDTPAKPPQTGSAGRTVVPGAAVEAAEAAMSAAFRTYTGTQAGQSMWNLDMEKTWSLVARAGLAAAWPHLAAAALRDAADAIERQTRDVSNTIKQMTAEVREVNTALGWRTGGNTFGDYIALIHSELSEALEAYRDHRLADATGPDHPFRNDGAGCCTHCEQPDHAGPYKPEGVGSEFADVLIRLLDVADILGIDLDAEFERKLAYNRTRPYQHGGRTLSEAAVGP